MIIKIIIVVLLSLEEEQLQLIAADDHETAV